MKAAPVASSVPTIHAQFKNEETMFKPLNSHIQIEPGAPDTKETTTGILLPDDFKATEERYITATVVARSQDVKLPGSLQKGTQVVVDRAMIEEINFGNKSINVILENYILGIIS